MAITINGSGTITGLSEGGIEDAKILPADLKANSGSAGATTFYRGDGAWAAAGGGEILQVVAEEEANYVANPSGYTTFFDLDITPVSASSKFIVNISSFYMLNDGREIQLRCRDSGSTYTGGIREFKNAAGGDIKAPFQATWYMDQSYSTGSATTFLVEFDDNGSTTAVGSSTSTWKSTMVVYEVGTVNDG